jgi:tetratricopeptide (TPR) repeat protein
MLTADETSVRCPTERSGRKPATLPAPMNLRVSFLLAVLAVLAAAVEPADLPVATRDGWIEVRTNHFTIYSNADTETATGIALDLEELNAAIGNMSGFRVSALERMRIFVFRDDPGFDPYKIRHQGRPAAIGGYFLSGPDGTAIAINARSRHDASTVVFHEYVHALMADNRPHLPVWLSEGLATFYETFRLDGETVTLGLPPARYLSLLENGLPIPVDEMLSVGRESPLYNEADRSGAFYAQSWAVTHTLLLGSAERRRQLASYFESLDRGIVEPEAFRSSFDGSLDAIEEEVLAHLRNRPLPTKEIAVAVEPPDTTTVAEIPPPRVLTLLGGLLASHSPPLPGAAEHLEEALELDPDSGRAAAWLAVVAEKEDRVDDALSLYRQASASDPENAWILYRYGAFLFRRTADRREAIDLLERSLQVEPDFAPAMGVLTVAYAESGRVDDARLETAEQAHRLLPTDRSVSIALLALTLRADRRERALELASTAFGNRDGDRRRAVAMIAANDLARTRDALVLGDLPEAERRLELARELVDASSAPDRLHPQIDELADTIAEHRAAARLESASKLYASGAGDLALIELDALLAERPDGSTAAAARTLQARILDPDAPVAPPPGVRIVPLTSSGEIDELNRRIAAGDLDAAIELLEDLDARVSADDRTWIDLKIEEIRRIAEHNRFAEAYNRAVDALNDGRRDEADTILTDLLATLPEGPEADEIRELLSRIRRAP